MAAPYMIGKDIQKDCIKATMIANIEDMVKEMRSSGRDDILPGGVDEEMIVNLEVMASGEEVECAIDIVSLGETAEGGKERVLMVALWK